MADYYRTTYTVTVLHDEPIPAGFDVAGVIAECDEGAYVMADVVSATAKLDGKTMADALYAAGSQPEFFSLDDDGNPESEN